MIEEKTYVYKITNPSGKIYIGSTINIKQRWDSYKAKMCKKQLKLYNSLCKYGSHNHLYKILWIGPVSEMYIQETNFGLLYNVLDKNKGLNLRLPDPNQIYQKVSQETKDKIGNAFKGKFVGEKHHMFGKKASEETKEKQRQAKLGVKRSKEACKNVGLARSKMKHSEKTINKLKGRKFSEESIQKMKEARLKSKRIDNTGQKCKKKIIDTRTGMVYESIVKAAQEIKMDPSSLSKKLRGKIINQTGLQYYNE
jgi:group I intron endonuclease